MYGSHGHTAVGPVARDEIAGRQQQVGTPAGCAVVKSLDPLVLVCPSRIVIDLPDAGKAILLEVAGNQLLREPMGMHDLDRFGFHRQA